MIALGLLLMLACAALAVDAVVQNAHTVMGTAFNQPITDLSLGAIFIAGAVLGLLFALGLLMFTGGIGRSARRRRQRAVARRDAETEAAALREHNERLSAELEARYIAPDDVYPSEEAAPERPSRHLLPGRHRA